VSRLGVLFFCACAWLAASLAASAQDAMPASAGITVGSKLFGESYLLAEIMAQLLEARGVNVERRLGLGGTAIVFRALESGDVDIYPEYTGTLTRSVFAAPAMSPAELDAALAERGLRFTTRFGFANNYAVAVPASLARSRGLSSISDLRGHNDLRLGFSYEFMNRDDGWPALRAVYELPQTARALEHALAYRALANDRLDVTDAYTTDGDLARYDLRILDDDRELFPVYAAGALARADLPATVYDTLDLLTGRLDAALMQSLNERVSSDGEAPATVAAEFLRDAGLVAAPATAARGDRARRVLANTLVHLRLTATALVLACLVAIPLALLVSGTRRLARAVQYAAGLLQTIPALALLALLIPWLGLGQRAAILALFLYSLLPILRNSLTGLFSVDPLLREVAMGMGLSGRQQLLRIELPLAMPMILAGVRTAAVISIGTATLAAFVGAGGLGEPIITGLSLNDNQRILEGAVPAALLAVAVEWLFELLERRLVPAHLRVR
jgi:osmoprotectant transport system permease protein